MNSTLPGPFTAVIADIEKIFPAGTQGNTTGLPVDIIGDMIIVLDSNWNAVWYCDSFQHDSGCPVPPATGPCQLDINRPAVLGETCGGNTSGCPQGLLLGHRDCATGERLAARQQSLLLANRHFRGRLQRYYLVLETPGLGDEDRLSERLEQRDRRDLVAHGQPGRLHLHGLYAIRGPGSRTSTRRVSKTMAPGS